MAVSSNETVLPGGSGDLHERIAGLTRVLDVTRHLAAEKDLDRLLNLVIHQACSALDCERASLFLYDEEQGELYTRLMTNDGLKEIRLSISKGIVGLAARDRRTVIIHEPYKHPDFNPEFDRRNNFRTRNILAAPLLFWNDDKLLGVLQLLNKRQGSFSQTDEELLSYFAVHAAVALERGILAKHYKDVEVAREIQESFFPKKLPQIPGYELAAMSRPADATGGDYYDIIPLPSGRFGLVVADVSGHGLGPALLMASVRAMLRGFTIREPAPEVLVTDLNDAMQNDLHAAGGKLITLLYGAFVPAEHCFLHADAGHGLLFHVQAGKDRVRVIDDDARSFPLGLFKTCYRACAPIVLAPGDLLVLATDGMVETRRDGKPFSVARLGDLILRGCAQPLEELLNDVFKTTTAYHDKGPPDDDMTLMILRRN